jgi:hypothetical protein
MNKKCPQCGKRVIGHPNKRFCKQKCKDGYHNARKPLSPWAEVHPFSSEAFEP